MGAEYQFSSVAHLKRTIVGNLSMGPEKQGDPVVDCLIDGLSVTRPIDQFPTFLELSVRDPPTVSLSCTAYWISGPPVDPLKVVVVRGFFTDLTYMLAYVAKRIH
jgi:hypothetical protein